ncbi:MAG: hypothetical protein LDL31_04445 [Prosthecobacter sp.]|jgi:hypothetical protein|nr:hypothetical protein [Prosthecobacter sp.]
MLRASLLLIATAATLGLVSCKTVTTARTTFPNTPVAWQLVSEMVDEETLDHTVRFRNIGSQVISFDYTIADEPGVPHTDAEGPNSGLVENLYPGAEASVKNPVKKNRGTYVVLGRVTYGKKDSSTLAKMYKPSAAKAAANTAATVGASLPLLEPVTPPVP